MNISIIGLYPFPASSDLLKFFGDHGCQEKVHPNNSLMIRDIKKIYASMTWIS